MWGRDPSPPPAESGGSASGSGSSSPSERRSLPTPTEDRARLMLSDGEEVMRQDEIPSRISDLTAHSIGANPVLLISGSDSSPPPSSTVAAINSQGVDDLFSDILYSNGKITVNEQELKLLRSPTPLTSLESGHDSEDSDEEEGSAFHPTDNHTSRDIAYPMAQCNDTDEEDKAYPDGSGLRRRRWRKPRRSNSEQLLVGGNDDGSNCKSHFGKSTSFSPSHEAQLRILRRATEVEVEAARNGKHSGSGGGGAHYPDLQRESGLRVLRGVIERKRSIEGAAAALTATAAVALTAARSAEMLKKIEDEADPVLRKRPPAKLKPITMGQRTNSHALSGSF